MIQFLHYPYQIVKQCSCDYQPGKSCTGLNKSAKRGAKNNLYACRTKLWKAQISLWVRPQLPTPLNSILAPAHTKNLKETTWSEAEPNDSCCWTKEQGQRRLRRRLQRPRRPRRHELRHRLRHKQHRPQQRHEGREAPRSPSQNLNHWRGVPVGCISDSRNYKLKG